METMPISKFKAQCLAVLQRVRKTRKPLLITRFGEPVAEILPPPPTGGKEIRLGTLASQTRILGDIISPAADPDEWEAMRE